MREELAELRYHIVSGHMPSALALVDDLEEMSRKAIIRNIRSYLICLLVHLVKNHIEKRVTNSWAALIRNSIREIQALNQQGNRQAYYIKKEEWPELINDAFEDAVYNAASEVAGGTLHPITLMGLVEKEHLCTLAQTMIADTYTRTRQELSACIQEHLSALPGGEMWRP